MTSDDYSEINLTNVSDGAALQYFDREMKTVMKNILDPNTDARS